MKFHFSCFPCIFYTMLSFSFISRYFVYFTLHFIFDQYLFTKPNEWGFRNLIFYFYCYCVMASKFDLWPFIWNLLNLLLLYALWQMFERLHSMPRFRNTYVSVNANKSLSTWTVSFKKRMSKFLKTTVDIIPPYSSIPF